MNTITEVIYCSHTFHSLNRLHAPYLSLISYLDYGFNIRTTNMFCTLDVEVVYGQQNHSNIT